MTTLVRGLGPVRATGVGLSAMIGAGLFVALGPVLAEAGSSARWAVLAAALVAGCNAASSARLAARHPTSGGTYVFARRRLDSTAGFLAGLLFVVGKTASCAAMALAVGVHLWPAHASLVAIAVVVVLTVVNLLGIQRSGDVALALTTFVIVTLLAVVAATVTSPATAGGTPAGADPGVGGVLAGAALMFFAFAGYARLATLGEEVRSPARTIPVASAVGFAIVTALYLLAAETVLRALPLATAASSPRALADAAETAGPAWAGPAVAVAAVVAAGGALLTLLLGVSRTVLAMARDRNLPTPLRRVNDHGVPWVAEVGVAGAVIVALPLVGVADVIGLSAACILLYYALTNLAAFTLAGALGRVVAAGGLLGCLALFFFLPAAAVSVAAALVGIGTAVHATLLRRR